MTIVDRQLFCTFVRDEALRRHIIAVVETDDPEALVALRGYLERKQLASRVAVPAEFVTHPISADRAEPEEADEE